MSMFTPCRVTRDNSGVRYAGNQRLISRYHSRRQLTPDAMPYTARWYERRLKSRYRIIFFKVFGLRRFHVK